MLGINGYKKFKALYAELPAIERDIDRDHAQLAAITDPCDRLIAASRLRDKIQNIRARIHQTKNNSFNANDIEIAAVTLSTALIGAFAIAIVQMRMEEKLYRKFSPFNQKIDGLLYGLASDAKACIRDHKQDIMTSARFEDIRKAYPDADWRLPEKKPLIDLNRARTSADYRAEIMKDEKLKIAYAEAMLAEKPLENAPAVKNAGKRLRF